MPGDFLPTSVTRETKKVVMRGSEPWVPIFCANCGCDGGWVPEASVQDSHFCFYLCDPCAVTWTPLADTMLVPDEVFFAKVNKAMEEKYGRVLTVQEQVEVLKDGESILSKLARERYAR